MKLEIFDETSDVLELTIDNVSAYQVVKLCHITGYPENTKWVFTDHDGIKYELFGCPPYGNEGFMVALEEVK